MNDRFRYRKFPAEAHIAWLLELQKDNEGEQHMLKIEDGKLKFHYDAEELWIEPWGQNSLRIRAN